MADGRTISRNRFFDPAPVDAPISATASGTGFTIAGFLDRGLEDVKSFPESKILSDDGISSSIEMTGTHVLEFIIAFRSKSESTCAIQCTFEGSDGSEQTRTCSVSGTTNDMARVSFHAPVE
jgi:hypothetical protein